MKDYTFLPIALTLVFASAAMSGCVRSDDSGNTPLSQDDYDDVAMAVGSLVANPAGGEIGSMADSMAVIDGSLATAKAVQGSGAHEVVIRAGLRYEYLVDCFDSAGTELESCDRATTDAANIAVDWSGDLDLPRYDATVERAGEWSLVGLQSDTAELNGAASFAIESNFEAINRPVTSSLALNYEATYDAILIDTNAKAIAGGTIRYQVQGTRNLQSGQNSRDGEFQATVVVTFTGDGNADLEINGTRSYQIDLDNGDVSADNS